MYAVIYRFGAFQVTRDSDDIAHASFEDVFRVIIALIFGAFSVGQASAFAPNYAKAKLSANRIFALLDREPIIDGYSTEGDELVSECGEGGGNVCGGGGVECACGEGGGRWGGMCMWGGGGR